MEKLLGHSRKSHACGGDAVRGPARRPLHVRTERDCKREPASPEPSCAGDSCTPGTATAKADLAPTTCQALCQARHVNYLSATHYRCPILQTGKQVWAM